MTAVSRSTDSTNVNSVFADNTTGDITASDARSQFANIRDSILYWHGDASVAADTILYHTSSLVGSVASTTLTSFMRTLLDDANATSARATLGVGSGTGDLVAANNLSDVADSNTARQNLAAITRTTATAIVCTNQTALSFTGIPASTFRVDIMLADLSTNGSSPPLLFVGTTGGLSVGSYLGTTMTPGGVASNHGNAIGLGNVVSTTVLHGCLTLNLLDPTSNRWTIGGTLGLSSGATVQLVSGSKALNAALERVQIVASNATDQFDSGVVNLRYYHP